MNNEQAMVSTAVAAWKQNVERAEKLFFALDDTQLDAAIAPGKNRLIYLLGHLVAVHDGMRPLLFLGERLHPGLEAAFVAEADRVVAEIPSATELKAMWTEVHDSLLAGFADLSPSDWASRHSVVSEADFALNPLRNRLAILLSRTSHIGYHLGQAQLAPR
ncbi:MAG: DinB family protein [Thermoanaerobaculia bacterium]